MSFAARALDHVPRRIRSAVRREYLTHRVARWGAAQEPDLRIAQALLSPGDAAVDIGANFGWYARALALAVGPAGRVDAFEPVPETAAILSHCLESLGLAQVRLHTFGISDRAGLVGMVVPNAYEARIVDGGAERWIPVQSLDTLWESRPWPIALVKVDVEGHEGPVLDGAQRVAAECRPAWVVEVTTPGVFPRLRRHGYGVWHMVNGRLVRVVPGVRTTNYWFLTEAHLARLARAGLVDEKPEGEDARG